MNERRLSEKRKKGRKGERSVLKNTGLFFNKTNVKAEGECPPGCFCDTKKGEVLPDHQVSWKLYL
jgi:hypothetical protein